MKDPVFHILQTLLANSPERSYKRLNPALRCALGDCIAADLPFQRGTFQRICEELRGAYWFGGGANSCIGEHFYTQACELDHASACQSFERFAGRPPVLWEQTVKTPARLHVGSQFTWQGYYVTVTSMRKDSLVACTYKDTRDSIENFKVGAEIGYDVPHVITRSKKIADGFELRLVKCQPRRGDCDVARRFTIPYADIAAFRSSENVRVNKLLTFVAGCNPNKDGKKLGRMIAAEKFRHFQLERINAAYQQRVRSLAEAKAAKQQAAEQRKRQREIEELNRTEPSRVEAWRNGANSAWLNCRGTYLRVRGDLVECSNGNSVSRAAVVRALPVVLDRRTQAGPLDLPLDGHAIQRLDADGVTIGCTLVPWSEVDRLVDLLKMQ